QHAFGVLDARHRRDLVVRALVERRRELERLVALLTDPDLGAARVDDRRRRVHEAEVQADLDEHEHHRHRHAGDRDRESQAVVQQQLARQAPHGSEPEQPACRRLSQAIRALTTRSAVTLRYLRKERYLAEDRVMARKDSAGFDDTVATAAEETAVPE